METKATTWTRVWRVIVGVMLAVGVASATVVLTPGFTSTLVLTTAVVGGLYGLVWGKAFPDSRHPVVTGVIAGPLCSLGVIGVIHLLGALGDIVLLSMVATSPWIVTPLRAIVHERRGARTSRASTPEFCGTDFREHLGSVPSAALAKLWAHTAGDLRRSRSTRRWLLLAEARSLILEEGERRDPVAFQAWLASNPDSSSFPALTDYPTRTSD